MMSSESPRACGFGSDFASSDPFAWCSARLLSSSSIVAPLLAHSNDEDDISLFLKKRLIRKLNN